jgi:hypothetical protein
LETYQQMKARLGRNPWAKLKVYKPGSWLTKGGWITVKGAEREIRDEASFMAARELKDRAAGLLNAFFPQARLSDAVQVVIE